MRISDWSSDVCSSDLEYLWWPSRATTHAPEGPDNGDGLRMLKRFFSYYRPYRTLFLLDFSCAVVAGLLELGFPMAVKAFIDHQLGRASCRERVCQYV